MTDGWKVGELARASGLSVRTVRYYDQIGLLTPSSRTSAGHRVYADADVRRLYRICLLRRAGFALTDIAHALDDPDWDLQHAVQTHVDMLDQQLSVGHALRHRLSGVAEALAGGSDPSTEEFLETLEEMTMLDTTPHRRIGMLVYDDIPAMQTWLARVFDLSEGRLAYDDAGNCVHGEVQAGDGVIWLHQGQPGLGLVSPRSVGATTGTTAVMVDDVDAHHTHAAEAGAEIVYPPTDQPYGYRDYSARDPEGGLWSFMKPLP